MSEENEKVEGKDYVVDERGVVMTNEAADED